MNTPPVTTADKNHRFPLKIISHAVWLYLRFCLSYREVDELLFERGVVVTVKGRNIIQSVNLNAVTLVGAEAGRVLASEGVVGRIGVRE